MDLLEIFKFQVTETPTQTDGKSRGDLLGHILEKASQGWNWDLIEKLVWCQQGLT